MFAQVYLRLRLALRRNRAFTLIELLVVILIIGILIAVAAPSFLGQTQKADDSAAQQQLATALTEGKSAWTLASADTSGFTTSANLVSYLQTSEPPSSQWIAGPDTAGIGVIDVVVAPPNTVTFCNESADTIVFCAQAGEESGLTSDFAANTVEVNYSYGPKELAALSVLAHPTDSSMWTAGAGAGWNPQAGGGGGGGGGGPVPANITAPGVPSGSAVVGDTLTADNGTWTNTPTSYTYQWEDCDPGGINCTDVVGGGTSSTYTLTSSDIGTSGTTIVVAVTAVNGNGPATSPTLSPPTGEVVADDGADITTVAGDYDLAGGNTCASGGNATTAGLNRATAVAVDGAGNLYIADGGADVVCEVTAATHQISVFAGTTNSSGYSGDNNPAASAQLSYPSGVAVDSHGNVFIADAGNNTVREVDGEAGTTTQFSQTMHEGDIYTIAGTGSTGYSGNGAIGTAATLNSPLGVAVDSSGNVYIADTSNNVIREVTASTGDISLVAGGTPDGRHGSATNGYGGDGGSANVATLSGPNGVAVDGNDNVYIADTGNNVIREVAGVDGTQFTQSMTVGDIYTIAGTAGEASYYGDGGFATDAVLNNPTGVAADASGNVYVADYTNNIVREITTADGNINTVAGTPTVFNYTGDGELATNATMSWENGIALDSSGHLYIADTFNGVIREVS